jgi:hypothetical protein
MLVLPMAGEMRAAGLTLQQLEEQVARRLGDYNRNVNQVSFAVTEFKSRSIYVLGRVVSPGRIHFAVTAADGEVLFAGTVPDPTLLHVEYEDDQGRLQKLTARQDPAIFTIRVPYDPRSHSVTIRRIDSARLEVKRVSEESTFLGTLVIGEEARNR